LLNLQPIILKFEPDIELVPVHQNEQYLLDMHAYSTLEEFYQYLEFEAFRSLKETGAYLDSLIERSVSPNSQYWFIKLKLEQVVVGTIGLHSLDVNRLSAEVGYGVSPHYQGRGIFSKSLDALLNYAFDDLALNRIVARTDVSNHGSIKGLLRNGFLREGIMRDYYRYQHGAFSDCALFSKLSVDNKK
jgi:ribosomal-protein-alanine N-acetyltransferase